MAEVQIGADTTEVRTQAGRLRTAGTGLQTSAGLGALSGGLGGGGSGTPLTTAALGTLGRSWARGLRDTGDSLSALGDYADAVAAAFDAAGA